MYYINENLMRSTIENNENYTHKKKKKNIVRTHYSNENNEGEMCLIIVKIMSQCSTSLNENGHSKTVSLVFL